MTKAMTREMQNILYKNTRKLIVTEGSLDEPANVLLALTANKKLGEYGVSLDASAIRTLSTQTAEEMASSLKNMISIIKDVSGAAHFNAPLFYPNFPEEVMRTDEATLYLNSLFYYTFGVSSNDTMRLIADEIRNYVTEDKVDRLPLIETHPRDLKIVTKGTEDDLFKMMNARIHSLNMSETQFQELIRFSNTYRREFNEMLRSDEPFQSKETKVKIANMLYESGRQHEIKNLLRDAVDVLRFAAELSRKNGMIQNTVELTSAIPNKEINFKLNRQEKKLIRSLLNSCEGLYYDVWKQEKLFKSLMPKLGTRESDGCPKRVVKAFDNLAHHRKRDEKGQLLYNANRLIPEAIEHLNKTGDPEKINQIAEARPGDFLRTYISSVTKTNPQFRHYTINAIRFCANSNSVPLRNLLVVANQLDLDVDAKMKKDAGEPVAQMYAHHNKYYAKVNNGLDLSDNEIALMRTMIRHTASEMVRGYQSLGTTYIDPNLIGVKAPGRNIRNASGGSVLTPYTKMQMEEDKNLLIFGIRWSAPQTDPRDVDIDVDLSVAFLDKDYKVVDDIWFGNLKSYCGLHSGDWTYVGETGASTEAILVDKKRMQQMGVKYLIPNVHCFNIESFKEAGNCKFVYEQREGSMDNLGPDVVKCATMPTKKGYGYSSYSGQYVMLGDVFEPAHLENCIDLQSNKSLSIPFVYDVEDNEMYWIDKPIKIDRHANVRNIQSFTPTIAEIEIAKHNPQPDMHDLFLTYALHNGELTDENIDREKLGIKETARVITGFDLDVISKEFSGNDDQSMIIKEEPQPEKVEKEPAIVKQFRYLHQKLNEYPRGYERDQDRNERELF